MTLPRTIPVHEVDGFKFLNEIDFFEYKNRMPRFRGEEGYIRSMDETVPVHVPRVVGFLDELAQAQEILTSSLTNSVYVTGREGVGKSALLLALLNKVALGDVSPALLSKHYYVFDLHEFFKLSRAEQIGQFDAAMDYMAKKNSLIIMDRIDDFIANCGPDCSRRLMSSLINALEHERVSAFVTSQLQNHDSIDQTSTLFVRFFKELRIDDRSAEETKNILRQVVPRFERKHKVIIGDDVVSEIMRLDQRYEGRLKGQSPNRQVEFLDQLAASVNIAKYGKPIELLKQEMDLVELLAEEELLKTSVKPSEKKISEVRAKINALQDTIKPQLDAWTIKFGKIRAARQELLEAQNLLAPLQAKYERFQDLKEKQATRRQKKAAADTAGEEVAPMAPEDVPQPLTSDEIKNRDTYMKAERKLKDQLAELEKGVYTETPHVTVVDVQARFSKIAGVSAKAASTNDAERLLKVEEGLSTNVYGQDHAKAALANIYRTREAGTSDPTRPAGVIFLTGGPGCGKTEMVETLARYDGSQIITYNMSLYTDASSVSRLMGAAPGLVGFGDVVTLPDAVKAKPKSFVFFDEIEKAHPDLQRTVMQVMDKGVMPDSLNLPVSFKDTIVIFASNVLRESDFKPEEKRDDKIVREKLTARMNEKTNLPYFLPEFIGRIDSVQLFDDVTPAIANLILHKEIRDINKGVSARGFVVRMEDQEAEKIVDVFFDATQGGRSIRQLSKNILRPLITQRLLTRQAAEASGEDGDLKPMALKIDKQTISIDGFTLASDVPEPSRPSSAASKIKEAASLKGGQK